MDLKLKGKRALVLGASRGLGYATARGLAMKVAMLRLMPVTNINWKMPLGF